MLNYQRVNTRIFAWQENGFVWKFLVAKIQRFISIFPVVFDGGIPSMGVHPKMDAPNGGKSCWTSKSASIDFCSSVIEENLVFHHQAWVPPVWSFPSPDIGPKVVNTQKVIQKWIGEKNRGLPPVIIHV